MRLHVHDRFWGECSSADDQVGGAEVAAMNMAVELKTSLGSMIPAGGRPRVSTALSPERLARKAGDLTLADPVSVATIGGEASMMGRISAHLRAWPRAGAAGDHLARTRL